MDLNSVESTILQRLSTYQLTEQRPVSVTEKKLQWFLILTFGFDVEDAAFGLELVCSWCSLLIDFAEAFFTSNAAAFAGFVTLVGGGLPVETDFNCSFFAISLVSSVNSSVVKISTYHLIKYNALKPV